MSYGVVTDYPSPAGAESFDPPRARHYCEQLEEGRVLYFDRPPFPFPQEDRDFLLSQRQSGFKGHKNVSYRPVTDVLRGHDESDPQEGRQLHQVMRDYSKNVTRFLGQFLRPYAGQWRMDFASFRPLEEQGRDLPTKRRNDLLHVDAFPTRPTHGGRILRVFTNVNPTRPRVWNVTDGFDPLARKCASDAGLPRFAARASSPVGAVMRTIAPALNAVGVKGADRSAYDRFMLHFHDWLKENRSYQDDYPKIRMEFPPNSTWMVYTDAVPHAVLSGQYALEQMYIVPLSAMVTPSRAPVRVLESLCGSTLVH